MSLRQTQRDFQVVDQIPQSDYEIVMCENQLQDPCLYQPCCAEDEWEVTPVVQWEVTPVAQSELIKFHEMCEEKRARLARRRKDETRTQARVPTKAHNLCGYYHALGTPCPILIETVPKIPKKPHTKCGRFHAVGTACIGLDSATGLRLNEKI
jgi:hypothetical protein